jgi:acylphosphatase
MKAVHCIISGNVQGVGYRQWVRQAAQHSGVTGWVKNRSDGSVEMVLSGDDGDVENTIREVRKGPPLSHVVDITINPYTRAETFSSFSVLQ